MHTSRFYHALLTWLVMEWSRSYHIRGLHINLEDNNKILSENGHEIIKGLCINFIYEKEGKHYFFRWQSNGCVDMYSDNWVKNLWKEGNNLHSQYSNENCDYKFMDAEGLIKDRVFSNELALLIRWPKGWSFSFNICPSNEYSGLISLGWIGCISLLYKGL